MRHNALAQERAVQRLLVAGVTIAVRRSRFPTISGACHGLIGTWRIGSDGLRLFLVAQGEQMQPRDHRHAGEEQRGAKPKRAMNIRVAYEP